MYDNSAGSLQSICHYLPVTPADVEWGAYVVGVGSHVCKAGDKYPLEENPSLYQYSWRSGRTLPEYRVTLVSDGEGFFESEAMGAIKVAGATLLLVFPNEWHRYRPSKKTGWTERWISANGMLFHRLYETHGITPDQAVFPIGPNVERELKTRFDEFLNRIHARPAHNSRMLSLHGLSLYGDLLEPLVESMVQENESQIAQHKKIDDTTVLAALEYIWTRSHRPLSVNDVARQLTVSRRTLDRKFASIIGRSVLDEINLCRIGRAKRLLRRNRLTCQSNRASSWIWKS